MVLEIPTHTLLPCPVRVTRELQADQWAGTERVNRFHQLLSALACQAWLPSCPLDGSGARSCTPVVLHSLVFLHPCKSLVKAERYCMGMVDRQKQWQVLLIRAHCLGMSWFEVHHGQLIYSWTHIGLVLKQPATGLTF